jgi:hypothetical protein
MTDSGELRGAKASTLAGARDGGPDLLAQGRPRRLLLVGAWGRPIHNGLRAGRSHLRLVRPLQRGRLLVRCSFTGSRLGGTQE